MVISKDMRNLKNKITLFLISIILVQIFAWFESKKYIPALGIVPDVPSLLETKISAIGDEQFYFRYLAIYIQNSGDTFGRFTKLKHYDYEALLNWFNLLDQLDYKSNIIPSAAAYLYSNTQRIEDNIYIVKYLESNYDYDPVSKWWWLGQAVIIAQDKLKDSTLALRLAFKLSNTPSPMMPRWAQQMPAIIYANMGERELALDVMQNLAEKYDDYTQGDLNYMNYFVKQQLGFKHKMILKEPKFHDVEPLYKRYYKKK